MNESTIKMFLTIAEEKSFSKAADRMFASQPNLSRSIIKMEEELGVQLFDRVGRKAELTEAGREFYDFFRRTQLEFQKVSAYARKLHSNRPGNIRIGYMEGWKISGFIDNVLNKLKENYPNMDVRMEACNRKELMEKLDRDEVDAVLGIKGIFRQKRGIKVKDIARIRRGVLCRRRDWETGKEPVPADFKNEIFFVMDEECNMILGEQIREFLESYGFVPEIQYVNSLESALNYVELGDGVLICDERTRYAENEDLLFVPLDSFHTVSIGWKRETKNVALAVLIAEL